MHFQCKFKKKSINFNKVKLENQYSKIGYSPIFDWTEKQGNLLSEQLNKGNLEENVVYKAFPAFRYSEPLYFKALDNVIQEHQENLNKIILFSQFPQFSCTTAGNILRECIKFLENYGINYIEKLEIIDRWYFNEGYINAIAEIIKEDLIENFNKEERDNVLIMFTAHSLPIDFIKQGDVYPYEIAATGDKVNFYYFQFYNLFIIKIIQLNKIWSYFII